MKSADWKTVSHRAPCRVCKSVKRCGYTLDGRVAKCCYALDGGVGHGSDDVGDFALYFNDTVPTAVRRAYAPPPESPVADVDTRDRTYRALLAACGLSADHRAALARRGLSDVDIARNGYATLPRGHRERARILADLTAVLGGIPADVPGLHNSKLPDVDGILVPARDHEGRVVGLKVRCDHGDPRYLWLSSKGAGGASARNACHVPESARNLLLATPPEMRVARLTEGELKADVATALSGLPTVAVPGAMAARCALDGLRALGVATVVLSWDADARTNRHVAPALERAAHLITAELPGVAVEVETWATDPTTHAPKGVDDALASGVAVESHAGADAWRALVGILRDAGCEPRAETLALAGMDAEDEVAPVGDPAEQPKQTESPRAKVRVFDRGDAVELARAVLDDLAAGSAHPVVFDRGAFWRYDDARGVFVAYTRDHVYNAVGAYAGCWTGTAKPRPLSLGDNAIKGALNAAAHAAARPGFFDTAARGVCFADAFLTAVDGEVRCLPHGPEHRCLHALPVRYEMDAERSRWVAMLREVFRRGREDGSLDHEDTEACICLLQEFIGACLMGLATSLAACLILVGEGNDGKSKVLGVLRALFPESALCALAPQDWGHQFRSAVLSSKRLNVVSELPERGILDAERFKAVVAGDPVTAERKNEHPFLMTPEAGHLFAANALPPTKDQSKGFWRRFRVIPCTRQFGADEEVRDYDKLVISEELAGVAAWAMDGAARVQAARRYTSPASSEEAHAEWRHDTDQVRQWKSECCTDDPSSEDGIEVLYAAYRAWCGETGHTALARNTFGARLKNLGLERRTKLARFYRVALRPRWRVAAQNLERRLQ